MGDDTCQALSETNISEMLLNYFQCKEGICKGFDVSQLTIIGKIFLG